jgi:hypothetical protein
MKAEPDTNFVYPALNLGTNGESKKRQRTAGSTSSIPNMIGTSASFGGDNIYKPYRGSSHNDTVSYTALDVSGRENRPSIVAVNILQAGATTAAGVSEKEKLQRVAEW